MRNKVVQNILEETPEELKIFVKLHADLTVRINQILRKKGMTQRALAEALNKKPSEINKWLKGEHNLTLRTIALLEAELGEKLIEVPFVSSHEEKESKISGTSVYVLSKENESVKHHSNWLNTVLTGEYDEEG